MKRLPYAAFAIISASLLWGAARHTLPMGLTEVCGFITGAACVWLTVKENIWNWPIGVANSAFYVALFFRARLYADMGLQVVYIVLGLLGWYWWLHGGEHRARLLVSRTGRMTGVILFALLVAFTLGMTQFLRSVHDSAPFWDALTTGLSLVAQYMLTKKLLENWYVWIAADIIYIVLYASKHLYLTSALYAVFLAMCVLGLREWRRSAIVNTGVHTLEDPICV